jgi:hypothetical protein
MELLQGLMDTDGYVSAEGKCEFCTTSDAIKEGFMELTRSLGYKPAAAHSGAAWRIKFHATADRPVFKLARKVARLRKAPASRQRSGTRQIVSITSVPSVPVRCIQVDSESRLYLAGRGMIPTHNTVLNPVSHGNNIMSNLTMAHFAGVSYWDAHKYVGTVRDLVKKAPMVDEAKKAGLWGGTFTQEDLLENMPEQLKMLAGMQDSAAKKAVDRVWNALSFWLRKPLGKAYNAEDQFFRYLVYRDARGRGLDPDDAVDYAQKFIFTYDDLPIGAKRVRDFGLPFFSYTYKSVPALASTVLKYPWRFAAPAAALTSINMLHYAIAAQLAEGGDDDWMEIIQRYMNDEAFRTKVKEQEEREQEQLPPWLKGRTMLYTPKALRLGVDDVTELPLFLDMSRLFPGGDLLDADNNAGGLPMLAPITPSNPILNTFGAIMLNRDPFLGKDVVDKIDTDGEAGMKRAKWIWNQFAPSIAVGSYHWDRALNTISAITGEPIGWGPVEYSGQGRDDLPVQPKYSALQTVGIKLRPIDLERQTEFDRYEREGLIKDIDRQMRRIDRLEQSKHYSSDKASYLRESLIMKKARLKSGGTIDEDPTEVE